MIITFCGHSDFLFSDDVKQQLKNILVGEIIKNPTCKFYLGGYGYFDGLCLRTLKNLKANFPEIELIFITPYLDKNYSKLEFAKYHYDDVIFPPLESVPRKFAILKRNEWMVDEADLVIAYVMYSWGGAAKTLEYAKRQRLVEHNFASRVYITPIQGYKKEIEILNDKEAIELERYLRDKEENPRWRIAMQIVLYIGLRRGEVAGLEWKDIDFENKTMKIARSVQEVNGFAIITK